MKEFGTPSRSCTWVAGGQTFEPPSTAVPGVLAGSWLQRALTPNNSVTGSGLICCTVTLTRMPRAFIYLARGRIWIQTQVCLTANSVHPYRLCCPRPYLQRRAKKVLGMRNPRGDSFVNCQPAGGATLKPTAAGLVLSYQVTVRSVHQKPPGGFRGRKVAVCELCPSRLVSQVPSHH